MCDVRDSEAVAIPWQKRDRVKIDKCLKPMVYHLNRLGVKTCGCCCGHGVYPPTLVVYDSRRDQHIDLFSGLIIPRKRNYYKMDSKGRFFIPETLFFEKEDVIFHDKKE